MFALSADVPDLADTYPASPELFLLSPEEANESLVAMVSAVVVKDEEECSLLDGIRSRCRSPLFSKEKVELWKLEEVGGFNQSVAEEGPSERVSSRRGSTKKRRRKEGEGGRRKGE